VAPFCSRGFRVYRQLDHSHDSAYHKSSYRNLPTKTKSAQDRASNPSPPVQLSILYTKGFELSETKAKFTEGPVGHMIILPDGPVFLPKFLVRGFVLPHCWTVVRYLAFTRWLAARLIATVFAVVGIASFLAYASGPQQWRLEVILGDGSSRSV